jgi:hypothetical protein
MAVSGTQICVDGSGQICVDGSGNPCVEDVACNSCSPPLSSVYEVTISGADGDFSFGNGTHLLVHNSGCVWRKIVSSSPGSAEVIDLYDNGTEWIVEVYVTTGDCTLQLDNTSAYDSCDPVDSYSYFGCVDAGCGTAGSCPDSSGAVATVAEAN